MWPLAHNLLALAVTAGGIGSALALAGDVNVVLLWGLPLGSLVAMNVAHTVHERRGTVVPTPEAELETLRHGMSWGFAGVLLAVPVLLTYRTLAGEPVSPDVGWVAVAGVAVFAGFALLAELRTRGSSTRGDAP